MKLRDVRPRYSQAWADANVEGSVLMSARIGTDGKVQAVEVVSPGNVELEDEAIAAVSQWEFSPTYLNCEPIEVRMYVTRLVQDRPVTLVSAPAGRSVPAIATVCRGWRDAGRLRDARGLGLNCWALSS